jgi:hypothetical protein
LIQIALPRARTPPRSTPEPACACRERIALGLSFLFDGVMPGVAAAFFPAVSAFSPRSVYSVSFRKLVELAAVLM